MHDDDDREYQGPRYGLDPEQRQFMARLMTGYEQANRRFAELCETLASRAERAEEVASRALANQVKLAEEREELASRRQERELRAKDADFRREQVAELFGNLQPMLLLLAKRFGGIPITGNDSHGLQDFLATMSEEQQARLLGEGKLELTQAQRMLLGAVIQSLATAEEEKEKAKGLPEPAKEAAE